MKEKWRISMNVEKCIDCWYISTNYSANPDCGTLVCTKPHLLVYVKEDISWGVRWWPAKLIKIIRYRHINNLLYVRYFHWDFETVRAPDECVLFGDSEEDLCKKKQIACKSKNELRKNAIMQAFEVIKINLYALCRNYIFHLYD